jgi:hypothetical protein
MKGILAYEEEELVSVDFIGNPHSSIVDAPFHQRGRRAGEGGRLVRQRVGVLEPLRGPGPLHGRAAVGCASAPSTTSAGGAGGEARARAGRLQRPARRAPAGHRRHPHPRHPPDAGALSSAGRARGAPPTSAGRRGSVVPEMSLRPVAARLGELLRARSASSRTRWARGARRGRAAGRRRRPPAGEHPLPPGEEKNDPELAEAARGARRPLRERRLRRRAPGARLHRGVAEVDARGGAARRRRAADGARAGVPRRRAGRARAPLRRDPGRRQDLRQDRRDPASSQGGPPADRRRHGQHLLPRDGAGDRHLAGGGGPGGDGEGAARRRGRQAGAPGRLRRRERVAPARRDRGVAARRDPGRGMSDPGRRARAPWRASATSSPRADGAVERAHGGLRDPGVRRGHARGGRGGGRRRRTAAPPPSSAAATPPRPWPSWGWRRGCRTSPPAAARRWSSWRGGSFPAWPSSPTRRAS